MATQSTLGSDLYVNGHLSAKTASLPASSVSNNSVAGSAGIEASKLQHQHQQVYSQNANADAAADRRIIHVVRGNTGEIQSFHAGVRVVCTGNSTITVKLFKNGTNILSADVVIDNSNTAYSLEAATGFTSTTLAQNDVLEVDVTVSAGTGTLGDGVFAVLNIREDAQ
jgi:hypothetical protein